jgi:hypothetical protein
MRGANPMARDRQTSLRLDGELLERLQQAARENRRTLGAEISLRLEQSFEPHEPADVLREIATASKTLAEASDQLWKRFGEGRAIPMNEDPNPYAEADRRRVTQKEKVKS